MKSWVPKKSLLSFFSIAAFLSVVLYCAGLFVAVGKIEKIEAYYSNMESASAQKERNQVLKLLVDANEGSIQILRNFFVKKEDEIAFIKQIEEIGRKASVRFEIQSIDISTKQENLVKEDVVVRLNTKSRWDAVINFIDTLEKMNFGVLIKTINLDANDKDNWSGRIEFLVFREK